MYRSSSSASDGRRQPPLDTHPHRGFPRSRNYNNHGPPNQQHHWKRSNFIVHLRSETQRVAIGAEIEAIVQKLKFQPQNFNVVSSNFIFASLFYEQWSETLETVVQLWGMKLSDERVNFLPRVVSNVEVASDWLELDDRLKVLFMEKLKLLRDGYLVKWQKKLGAVVDEISRASSLLARPQRLGFADELLRKRKGLEAERDLILNRMQEFKCGIQCVENYLDNGGNIEQQDVSVFRFADGKIDWERIYGLMMRECRRLDDGLPIYAHRRDILKQIHRQQVTVLIGETGSGKSTQLVQFLADSGVSGQGSIICTQPRKLAAISLAERVKDENRGCSNDTSVICYPSYSSHQEFGSKVIYMTDHCLLLHYMRDNQLSKISCIIIDEAHERSLNTDLLLALIKKLLCRRPNLRVIVMSATMDVDQFTNYFFGCRTFHVAGRNFPVDIKYVACESEGLAASKSVNSYVDDVLRTIAEIIKTKKEGTILAFLTSQIEVECACEKFRASSAIVLPFHGKLSCEEQRRVFIDYPGKSKVVFATNVAETSLTIPGVKYVVDSGMAKENMYEPATRMNVLKVCRISQSSANQRAGRAGRTEPGMCYRLYTENAFKSMRLHQEPEIRKVHLGVAILKIIALGVKNVQEFDFVDAPSAGAIDMAIRNLIHVGAIAMNNDVYELTTEGRKMVKLGVDPQLGRLILQCFREGLGKEGLVLAAVMANSSSIFCRFGTEENKLKSDRLKVPFCHPNGDLFTLLAVYREWEVLPREKKNMWCWENSINAKSMRRCQDSVLELESCLKNELNMIVPSYWCWDPHKLTERDKNLKSIILSSMSENVALYSGNDKLGYKVALTGKHFQLHPSCSLLNFGERPAWVVFREILSVSNEYLVCVTACDFECFTNLSPRPVFDFLNMNSERLQKRSLSGFGSALLKRFCDITNNNLRFLVSSVRESFTDERIDVEVNVDQNEVLVYASSQDIKKVCDLVKGALEYGKKLLQNECLVKCLFRGDPTVLPSFALFGSGAEIKHLELDKRDLAVDIFHSNMNSVHVTALLLFLEKCTGGQICGVSKFFGRDNEQKDKWGSVTFLTPDAAKKAVDLNQVEFGGGLLKVVPLGNIYGDDLKRMSFPAIRTKILWPRCRSKGTAILKCGPNDVALIVNDLSNILIGSEVVRCEASVRSANSVVLTGLDKELSEDDIYEELRTSTDRRIAGFFLVRGNPVDNPSLVACEEAIMREIAPFVRGKNHGNCVRVQVFEPEPKRNFMRAAITFDGNLHLEAARALEHIEGKVLPGCQSWQKIQCRHSFSSYVHCPAVVYPVIRSELHSLFARLQQQNGVECNLEPIYNNEGKLSSYRVTINAEATRIAAQSRRCLGALMEGTIINHSDLSPAILQILFSQDGEMLKDTIQHETKTHIMFDKRRMILKVFGSRENTVAAEERLVKSLVALHDSRQPDIHLRDGVFPPDMMKRIVQNFGPDLDGLRQKVPGTELSLNTRRHTISIRGTKESKQKVEEIIHNLAETSESFSVKNDNGGACPICLCELEDSYKLEDCRHEFCRLCLVEQCESAIKNLDSFLLLCCKEGCRAPILVTDMKSLLSEDKLDLLFRASLGTYVAASGGVYRFCPSPDCPSVYQQADPDSSSSVFVCGTCGVETCTRCHLEYHPYVTCDKYREIKDDPDASLKEWCMGKENVKTCPGCGLTIEKVEGCNHIECRCGKHVCWVCLDLFGSGDECYAHLRSQHAENYELVM